MFAEPTTVIELAAAGRLIDVRSPAEFRACHIPGAVNLPLEAFRASADRIARVAGPLVLTCHSGQRAAMACALLTEHRKGPSEGLLLVEGGTARWQAAGRPVNLGRPVVSLERQVRMVAGGLVATGAILALVVSTAWIYLPLGVGTGLLLAGATNTCMMGNLLSRMPWNTEGSPPTADILLRLEGACSSSA